MASLCVGVATLLVVGASCVSGLGALTSLSANLMNAGKFNAVPNDVRQQIDQSELLFTTPDFVTKYGYPVETHTVTTEDGYLLTVHRIPDSPKAPSSGVKTPVLVQHGMGAASDCWVLMGPERGLGFILADEGYDVWMGNARGNRYSRNHVSLSPRDLSFFNFTWHEMGVYDLPAVIDHILHTTNQQQLFYIGHSMGGTIFFVLASTRPEYNKKIRLAVVMAPGVYFWRMRSILRLGFQAARMLHRNSAKTKVGTFGVAMSLPLARLIYAFCADGKPFQQICLSTYFALFGFDYRGLNTTMLPSIVTHGLSGNSIQLLNHYAQLMYTERFQKYDGSGRKYSAQPMYDLSKVTAPVSVHYASNDILVRPQGVIHLSQRLPNLVKIVRVPDDRANHNVFMYATRVKQLVYEEVLDLMRRF